jgi:hypothetical protein
MIQLMNMFRRTVCHCRWSYGQRCPPRGIDQSRKGRMGPLTIVGIPKPASCIPVLEMVVQQSGPTCRSACCGLGRWPGTGTWKGAVDTRSAGCLGRRG